MRTISLMDSPPKPVTARFTGVSSRNTKPDITHGCDCNADFYPRSSRVMRLGWNGLVLVWVGGSRLPTLQGTKLALTLRKTRSVTARKDEHQHKMPLAEWIKAEAT